MRVCFTNLGCKLNQAELEEQARRFHAAGHRVVASLEEADLHVVNTCTVTHVAARASRKVARRGHRLSGRRGDAATGVRTVLTGCWATQAPDAAAELPGVELVVPNAGKDGLLEAVHERFPDAVPEAAPVGGALDAAGAIPATFPSTGYPVAELPFGNTRAAVKIEDGCNVGCTFCIIPLTRGRQHSRPVADVVADVRALVARGAREVVVEGVQISHYRHGGAGLADLVAAVLGDTAVPRLRLTSIAPWSFDERLYELWSDPRLCRHVHMSLQSGCDATLARMRRPYTAAEYAAVAARLRAAVPGVALTTDVIAGFPGETDEEFAASLAFVEQIGFSRVHAFPFSTRAGTAAEALPDHLSPAVKKRRMAALLEVAAASERRYRESWVGETLEVLWERRRERALDGILQGTSDNYLRVSAVETGGAAPPPEPNTLGRVRVERLADEGVWGVPLTADERAPTGRAAANRAAVERAAVAAS